MSIDVIRVADVTKQFTIHKQKALKDRLLNGLRGRHFDEQFNALDHVDLNVRLGESLGLVGPNGSGKSTLLKVIGGILAPNSGRVLTRGRIAALLELGAGFHPDLSGRENIYLNASVLGLSKAETDKYFDDIVDFSGIPDFIDTQVKFYSSGMYVRLAFAVAVHVDPDILLVDEVLAVGDEPFQQKCMAKIHQFQKEGRTIVFVSHSAGQVADLCDRAIVLENGKIVEDGVPLVALSRLKRDYSQTITANQEGDTGQHSRWKAVLEHIYLTDIPASYHNGEFQIVARPGVTVRVHGEIVTDHLPAGWALRIAIESIMGGTALRCDTANNLHRETPEIAGSLPWMLSLPDLNLGEGDYAVDVTLVDSDGKTIDEVRHAAMLASRTNKRTIGTVYSAAAITFGDEAKAPPGQKSLAQLTDEKN